MKSMTGFGTSEMSSKDAKIIVEARSENHRFLDLKLLIPEYINEIEDNIHKLVRNTISRGKIRLTISLKETNKQNLNLNKEAAREYFNSLKKFKKDLGIIEEVKLEHILNFKELFNGNSTKNITKTTLNKIQRTVQDALKMLEKSRISEGFKLKKDLEQRIDRCENYISKIKNKRSKFKSENYKKLREKIKTLLEDIQIDEPRLFQEVAYLSERTEITEELVRLGAHLEKFKETMFKKTPVGKELDFLIQEMNREAGTISAKAKDAQISHLTINLRSEFEKIREQIQNIE